MMKRLFDVCVSAVALLALSPLLALVAVLVMLDSPGPALFRQERVGRRFRPFVIYKFRTMYVAQTTEARIAIGNESRVTRVGRLLRRAKIDELPQLINVLKGDMSLVGPRPEVRQYVDLFREDYAEILEARPGLTDLASIKYRNEAALLAGAADPEAEYVARILPDKIRLGREYVRRSSVLFDIAVLAKTLWHVAGPKAVA
jgi:lipopolysaccharide/colanic/teichoic acid biosynthesis glycosyltransferase